MSTGTLGHALGGRKIRWHSGNKSAIESNTRRADLAPGWPGADVSAMTRPLRLAGALAVVLSLWLPWYQVRIPDELRRAFDDPTGQLPQGFAEFARGLLAVIPASIELNGWQAFEGTDVALALLAGAIAGSVLLSVDVRAILAAAAGIGGLVVVHMLDQPGPNEVVSLKVGPWVALAGAVAIALSARGETTSASGATSAAWAPASPPVEPWAPPAAASVPPPSQ
jgi:hypothetical protein